MRIGQYVVLKDKKRPKAIGFVCDPSGYDCQEGHVLIKWVHRNRKIATSDEVIEDLVEVNPTVIGRTELKVGQIVLTNGSSWTEESSWTYGVIGEIRDNSLIFIWNSDKSGSYGTIKPPARYKHSFSIHKESDDIKVIILDEKQMVPGGRKKKCEGCYSYHVEDNMTEYKDNFYCEECMKELFFKCEDCEEIHLKADGIEYNDKIYCKDCFEEFGCRCDSCAKPMDQDDACNFEDETYCEECYKARFTECADCGNTVRMADSGMYEGHYYCDDCFSQSFSRCGGCGHTIRNDDARSDEGDEEVYCEACYRRRRGKEIHDYGFRPNNEFGDLECEKPGQYTFKCKEEKEEVTPLYLGIELEVQHDDYSNLSAEFVEFLKKEKLDSRFYLKHDSSIGEGFEIVSHPFTLAYMHKKQKMIKILEWLKKEDFDSEESGECGLHIHVSKDFFEERDITKLRLFFKKNQRQLEQFSRRNGNFHYCMFEELSPEAIVKGEPQSGGRYNAVNLASSRETIEFRFFRGTLDYKTFQACIQFSDAISRFVKRVGITCFLYGEGEYKNNSWKLFLDWAKNENRYKEMVSYLVEKVGA